MNTTKLSLCSITLFLSLLCITINISSMIMVHYPSKKKLYCGSPRIDVHQYFIDKYENEALLRKAAENKDENEVKRLLERDAVDINAKSPRRGDTALHYAAYKGHIAIGKILLAKGANVNIQNQDGFTPLYDATRSLLKEENGEPFITFIDLLLTHNAKISIKDIHGKRLDRALTIIVGETPPHELDEQRRTAILEQCLDENKFYRLDNFPGETLPIPTIEDNKQKRLNINHAHSLLLCAHLQELQKAEIKKNMELYYQ